VSCLIVEQELKVLESWSSRHGLRIDYDPSVLRVIARVVSRIDHEVYVVELTLDDYRALPPAIQFIHPGTGERGTPRCFPQGGRGYFHNQPVFCAPWNRLAYGPHGGPHNDWQLVGWEAQAQRHSPNHTTLADMFALIQELVNDPDSYKGRMAP
jgi:hypothetical protein